MLSSDEFSGVVDNPMSLKGFPFDEDSLDIRLVASRLRDGRPVRANDVVLRAKDNDKCIRFLFDRHLPEFQILGCTYIEYISPTKNKSYFVLGISVRRKHWYYFFKVTILMWMIVAFTMPVYLFSHSELEQRITLTSTMFLATAATLYVVGQDLPKTEKLNKMDLLLLSTLLMLFTAGAESMVGFILHQNDAYETADALERWIVIIQITMYVLVNICLFGIPAVAKYRQGDRPCLIPPQRAFIPWNQIQKRDMWGAEKGSKILTGTSMAGSKQVNNPVSVC